MDIEMRELLSDIDKYVGAVASISIISHEINAHGLQINNDPKAMKLIAELKVAINDWENKKKKLIPHIIVPK